MTASTHQATREMVEETGPGVAAETDRPMVTVGELQRAWEAVQSGHFRSTGRNGAGPAAGPTLHTTMGHDEAPTVGEWIPAETVIPIIGAGGGVGATTLALALATISSTPARVVECCSASASGLASASTAELGATDTGWCRGLREDLHHRILLERAAHPITTAVVVPLPTIADQPVSLTILDCGWDLDHLLASGWIAQLVSTTPALVVAATATIPGMRRLEVTLEALDSLSSFDPFPRRRQVTAAVLGPRRNKWDRHIEGSLGPATRDLDANDGLIQIPLDRALKIRGLTPAPLPHALLTAATHVLDRLPVPSVPADPADPAARAEPAATGIGPELDASLPAATASPTQPWSRTGTAEPSTPTSRTDGRNPVHVHIHRSH